MKTLDTLVTPRRVAYTSPLLKRPQHIDLFVLYSSIQFDLLKFTSDITSRWPCLFVTGPSYEGALYELSSAEFKRRLALRILRRLLPKVINVKCRPPLKLDCYEKVRG